MRGRVDKMTLEEAVRHFNRYGSQNHRAKDFIMEAQTSPTCDGVLHLIAIDKPTRNLLLEASHVLQPSQYFEVQKAKKLWDWYILRQRDSTEEFQRILDLLQNRLGLHITSRVKNGYNRGYIRVLSAELALSELQTRHEQAGTVEDFEKVEAPYLLDASGQCRAMGLQPRSLLFHHLNKKQVEKLVEIAQRGFRAGFADSAEKLDFEYGRKNGKSFVLHPAVFAEVPGFYDAFLPWAQREDTFNDHDIMVIKTLADTLGLDVWDKLQGEIERGASEAAPTKINGYLRVFDKDQSITKFRELEQTANEEDKKAWARILAQLLETREDWRMLLFHGVDQEQLDRLKEIDAFASVIPLPGGKRFEVILCGVIPMNVKQLQLLARGFGLILYEEMDQKSSDMVTIHVYPPGRITPQEAIESKDELEELCSRYFNEMSELASSSFCPLREAQILMMRLPENLRRADCVIWKPEMWEAAISGSEVFENTVLDQEFIETQVPQVWFMECLEKTDFGLLPVDWELPEGTMDATNRMSLMCACVMPATEMTSDMSPEQVIEMTMSGKRITGKRRGLLFCLIFNQGGMEHDKRTVKVKEALPIWRFLPALFAGERAHKILAPFIAASKFMRLEIVSKEPVHPPRHFRRRAEREGRRLPDVHTIYLRRTVAAKKDKTVEEGSEVEAKRQYRHSFMVGWPKGFWRNQWYPSMRQHKQIYIAPFLKGDPSLPFKSAQKRIYKVAR